MYNSDLFYYANNLFVNIYAFIQSNIARAVLFKLIKNCANGVVFGIFVDRSSRVETGCPGSDRRTAAVQMTSLR